MRRGQTQLRHGQTLRLLDRISLRADSLKIPHPKAQSPLQEPEVRLQSGRYLLWSRSWKGKPQRKFSSNSNHYTTCMLEKGFEPEGPKSKYLIICSKEAWVNGPTNPYIARPECLSTAVSDAQWIVGLFSMENSFQVAIFFFFFFFKVGGD